MATPIQNAQFLAALTQPTEVAMQRRNQNLLSLALREQQAQRAKEAAQAEAQLRMRLAAMQESGAMRRAELSNDAAMARLDAQQMREDNRIDASNSRADKKELQNLRESINSAHRAYVEAGGTDKVDSFGDIQSTDRAELLGMLSRLTDAAGRQAVEAEAGAVEAGLSQLSARAAALQDQLGAQVEAYVEQTISGMAAGIATKNEDFGEAYNKQLAQGASPDSALQTLAKTYPNEVLEVRNAANAAALEKSNTLRNESQFRDAFRALQDEREMLMKSAAKPGVSAELMRRRAAFMGPDSPSAGKQGGAPKMGDTGALAKLAGIDFTPEAASPQQDQASGRGLLSILGGFRDNVPDWASKDATQLAPIVGGALKKAASNADRFASTALANVLYDTGDPVIDEVADRGLGARGLDSLGGWLSSIPDRWSAMNDRIRAENVRQSQVINAQREADRKYLNSIFGDPDM